MSRIATSILLAFSLPGALAAQPAQSVETQTFVAAPGDSIVVTNDYGRVRVSAWAEPHVEVRIRRIAANPGDLATVEVSAAKDADTIFVRTSFFHYASQSVYIDVRTPSFMGLVVWGANPAVEIYGLSGYTRVHTLTGLITASDLTASTSLGTDSGDILYYANAQPRSDVRLDTVRGSIRCHVNPDLNLRSWMRAGNTLTWNDEVEMSQGSLEKQLGIGGPLLYANSAEGGVRFLLSGNIDTSVLAAGPEPASPAPAASRPASSDPPINSPAPRADRGSSPPPVLTEDSARDNPGAGSRPPVMADPVPERVDDRSRRPAGQQAPQPGVAGSDGSPLFRVGVDWVYLNASVRDRRTNRAVPHLNRDDFELFEDGAVQRIERFNSTEAPYNLLMLLDVSGSTREYLGDVKGAAIEFTELIKPSDRVAVASFNSRPQLRRDFTNDRHEVGSAINRLRSGGGTAFYDALAISVGEYVRDIEGRKAIVVFTDGVDNRLTGQYSEGSHIDFRQLYRLVEESDTLIYTIFLDTEDEFGRGRSPSSVQDILEEIFKGGRPGRGRIGGGDPAYEEAREQLQLIADQTGGRFYAPNRISDLNQAFAEIADDLRIQYTLGYSSTNAQADGKWRDIRLKVKNRDFAVRTRKGYYAPSASSNP